MVGGTIAALDAFEDEARHGGAMRIVRLKVHVASHTKRLAAASVAFTETLKRADIRPAPARGVRLFAGIDGSAILDAKTGIAKLADQISHTVEWASCIESCVEAGATTFLELGPGHVLSAMIASTNFQARARSADDFRSTNGLRGWIKAMTE